MGWTAAGHWEETALNKKTSGWHLNIRHAVAIGIVLLLAVLIDTIRGGGFK